MKVLLFSLAIHLVREVHSGATHKKYCISNHPWHYAIDFRVKFKIHYSNKKPAAMPIKTALLELRKPKMANINGTDTIGI